MGKVEIEGRVLSLVFISSGGESSDETKTGFTDFDTDYCLRSLPKQEPLFKQSNAECLPNTKRILMKLEKFSFDKSFTRGSGQPERRLISQGVFSE